MKRLAYALLVVATPALAEVPAPAIVRAHATRRTSAIVVDGRLDDAAWATAPRQTGFVQRYPKDGATATLDTSFAVLYDDDAIYVGVWADDPDTAGIRRLLTRRDIDAPADSVAVGFDSYHDRRTAYMFQLNAAGVQRDMVVYDDATQDDTWDAVWTGDAAVTDRGWTAEFRIPLSQLRYAAGDTNEWGLQIFRTVARTQEQSTWSPWPRSGPQVVSKFGVVDGIDHLKPSRRLEVLPYVTAGIDRAPSDPLNARDTFRRDAGADLKYGLGPAFTLSATINPDFGQVEADPSQITLGPYELFYPEKRPFFLEGADLFKLPIGNGDGNGETEFYSRRIGEPAPNEPTDYTYIRWPQATTIYGAAKLTGHAGGWSLGLLDAVTGEEQAAIVDDAGVQTNPTVAPLTNYAIARVKRDLNDGKTSIGVSGTAVDRALDGNPELAATLHDQAYTGGLQIQDRWWDNKWQLNFHAVGSYVHGTTDAIAATQLDTNHLFQRVGATDVHFDPLRTSIEGFGGTMQVGRLGDVPHFRIGFGDDSRSPGLELNDLGFQQGSDRNIPYLWTQWRDDAPGDSLLNYQVGGDVYAVASFEQLTDLGVEWNASGAFPNMWSMFFGGSYDKGYWDQVAMRGGPALRADPTLNLYGGLSTDNRKLIYFSIFAYMNHNWTTEMIASGGNIGATLQAAPNVDLFVGPSYSERTDPMQYVTEVDTAEPHYIFAGIYQTTTSMTMRLDWTFSTHLSLQAYAQPFIATGRYSTYKDVDNPSARQFADRFHVLQGNEISDDGSSIYIHRAGQTEYSFAKPDFDLRQLRSTIVLRWEYRPGSTVFAIWSHGQSSSEVDGRLRPAHDIDQLLRGDAEDIVMVKANYWFGF